MSEKVVSNLRPSVVSLCALWLFYYLKLTFPTPLFSPSIASLLYRQILSMHVKPIRRRSMAALEAGVKTAVHAKIHFLGVLAGVNSL